MDEQRQDPPGLFVRGLGKRFGDEVAVADLDFEVPAGEILGLLGPNGAGKTTTLRTIAGVLPVQAGEVRVAGHDIRTDEQAAKRCLAWMPDEPEPFDALTVHEHLEFTARLYGIADWERKADELLAMLELEGKRDALGGELSRGMRQKLAICCAWLSEPRVALLDEPLSGLDPRGIRTARDAIRGLASGGAAVVLSSHLLELVDALADRLLIIDHGRRVFLGTPLEARRMLAHEGGSLEDVFLAATSRRADSSGAERVGDLPRGEADGGPGQPAAGAAATAPTPDEPSTGTASPPHERDGA